MFLDCLFALSVAMKTINPSRLLKKPPREWLKSNAVPIIKNIDKGKHIETKNHWIWKKFNIFILLYKILEI